MAMSMSAILHHHPYFWSMDENEGWDFFLTNEDSIHGWFFSIQGWDFSIQGWDFSIQGWKSFILEFWPLIFTMHCKCFVLSMLHAQKNHSYRRMKKSYPSKFKDKTFLSLDGKISSLDGKKSSMDGIFICQKKSHLSLLSMDEK